MAAHYEVSTRTLRNWRKNPEQGRIGRPPHDARARRRALLLVRREMKRQGRSVGRTNVLNQLRGVVPVRLVQSALREWKRRDRRREDARRRACRVTIEPAGPGVLASLDGLQLGRVDGAAVKGELVIDVASTNTIGRDVGGTMRGEDVVRVLDQVIATTGAAPLAVVHDRGSENLNAAMDAWCAANLVVQIPSVARTPQHNPWIERKNGEVRAVSGLRAATRLTSLEEARRRLDDALRVLDRGRARSRLSGLTAAERDPLDRVRYTLAERARLWTAACAARDAARENHRRTRDRQRAEREALLGVLESFGLIRRTRGGRPVSRVIPEIIS